MQKKQKQKQTTTMYNPLPAIVLLATVLLYAPLVWAWPGTVVRVQDGDSLLVAPTTSGNPSSIRLYGIDAPELHQRGGESAYSALQALLPTGHQIDVQNMDKDPYGRIVGLVTVQDSSVNAALLNMGQAWFNTLFCKEPFCKDWKKIERRARKQKKGLWAESDPEAPWRWRKRNPQKTDNAKNNSIQGNSIQFNSTQHSSTHVNSTDHTQHHGQRSQMLVHTLGGLGFVALHQRLQNALMVP